MPLPMHLYYLGEAVFSGKIHRFAFSFYSRNGLTPLGAYANLCGLWLRYNFCKPTNAKPKLPKRN